MRPVQVVILGGGYVAVWGYRALMRRVGALVRRGAVAITVVSPEEEHAYHGWTGEVLGGIIPPAHRLSALAPLMPHAAIIRGEAIRVDLERRLVSVQAPGGGALVDLRFDHLVFGTGSRDRVESVPGLAAHGWQLKQPDDLLALRRHVSGLLRQAAAVDDAAALEQLLTIVIAGGGFTGVEMCAALAELLGSVKGRYPVLKRQPPRLVLLHAGPALLPQLRPRYDRLAEYATAKLAAYGAEVCLETRLAAVTAEGAVLSDGRSIGSRTVISTLGQAPGRLPGTEDLPRDASGRLITDEALHVGESRHLWAGGDAACVRHYRTGEPCPANALWALKHGERLGDNIGRTILGRPVRPFRYPGLGQAASLGIGKAAVELYTLQFTGWIGWLMRLSFFLFFMPSRRQAARVLWDWVRLAAGRRDRLD